MSQQGIEQISRQDDKEGDGNYSIFTTSFHHHHQPCGSCGTGGTIDECQTISIIYDRGQ